MSVYIVCNYNILYPYRNIEDSLNYFCKVLSKDPNPKLYFLLQIKKNKAATHKFLQGSKVIRRVGRGPCPP